MTVETEMRTETEIKDKIKEQLEKNEITLATIRDIMESDKRRSAPITLLMSRDFRKHVVLTLKWVLGEVKDI